MSEKTGGRDAVGDCTRGGCGEKHHSETGLEGRKEIDFGDKGEKTGTYESGSVDSDGGEDNIFGNCAGRERRLARLSAERGRGVGVCAGFQLALDRSWTFGARRKGHTGLQWRTERRGV